VIKYKLHLITLALTALVFLLMSIAGAEPQTTPTISLSKPADIVYGTPLSSTQQDASALDQISKTTIPATIVCTPSSNSALIEVRNKPCYEYHKRRCFHSSCTTDQEAIDCIHY